MFCAFSSVSLRASKTAMFLSTKGFMKVSSFLALGFQVLLKVHPRRAQPRAHRGGGNAQSLGDVRAARSRARKNAVCTKSSASARLRQRLMA